MLVLVVALLYRVTHEADSGEVKRLLILFPIVAVGAVFLIKWRKEKFQTFSVKLVIALVIGLGLLLLA